MRDNLSVINGYMLDGKRKLFMFSRSYHTVALNKNITCHLAGCGCSNNSFVWISDKLKCIYFEIPKAGSTSIKSVIKDKKYGFYQIQEGPKRTASRLYNYYKFAVVRNPIDRMVSNYNMFCLSDSEFRRKQIEALFRIPYNRISFKKFLECSLKWKNHHWEQMAKFLPIVDYNNPFVYLDDLIPLHSLNQKWKELKRNLGISCELPKLNASVNNQLNINSYKLYNHELNSMFGIDIEIYKIADNSSTSH